MTTWPNTLPPAPLLGGFHETVPNSTIRTDREQGPAKVRQRTTAAVRSLSVQYLMSKAQIDTLETFYQTTLQGGAYSFTFTHPRTGNAVTCRFTKPPEYTTTNGNFFHVAVDLEVLP